MVASFWFSSVLKLWLGPSDHKDPPKEEGMMYYSDGPADSIDRSNSSRGSGWTFMRVAAPVNATTTVVWITATTTAVE